ncbi:MAG: prepilin-type N-terminal cleavage/methylation domain-containing protein [Candidatus Microbacterium phytovorans]|uniref:Prepilin-type N-terminal cleavage/methylation domain-containing protein n=1 Tax=Candidatus Microbacterium phytovorans TaxID=3121374 RepID=A0AAJ5W1E9_9MICO|nr:prepilin-type N-terminal cleavage/methylation domain-containing protein [Microbacterium sp.]WEK14109.1 MAG: prepilin-type N-terminal cleavage/methylation domain-containing protein [Microbacterium sp.]
MFQRSADDGFSLVEVLISLFLLAMLALAVLPLLVGATRVSVSNRDLATATAFANAQLAPIKTAFPTDSATTSCASLRTQARTGIAGPDGTTAAIAVNPCPATSAGYPASVPVTVTVTDSDGDTVVRLVTRLPVGAP